MMEHVDFIARRNANPVDPHGIEINMACRACQRTAAERINPLDIVTNSRLHQPHARIDEPSWATKLTSAIQPPLDCVPRQIAPQQ